MPISSDACIKVVQQRYGLFYDASARTIPALAGSALTSTTRTLSSTTSKKGTGQFGDSNKQHEEWVKFQQGLVVDGFETGAITKLTDAKLQGRKVRGGKQLRKQREKDKEERATQRTEDLGRGLFPPLRYSEEETARLLKEAYAAIPERAGPRRSRAKKRERNRQRTIRFIQKTYKDNLAAAHTRKMEDRSRVAKESRVVRNTAERVRESEREYQNFILERSMAMSAAAKENSIL